MIKKYKNIERNETIKKNLIKKKLNLFPYIIYTYTKQFLSSLN